MIEVNKIDNEGFFIGIVGINKVEELDGFCVTTPILVGFYKAKWTGTEWVEGATQQEIEEWQEQNKPNPPQPSVQDTLNAQLLKSNAETKIELNKQKQLNSQLLLEIAKLKQGGNTNV